METKNKNNENQRFNIKKKTLKSSLCDFKSEFLRYIYNNITSKSNEMYVKTSFYS